MCGKYGREEIRTPGSRVRTPRLKPGTLNHSVTRPYFFPLTVPHLQSHKLYTTSNNCY